MTDSTAEIERLTAALREAHRQLSRYDVKGPKQVGRAMLTIEKVLPDLMPEEIREILAAHP